MIKMKSLYSLQGIISIAGFAAIAAGFVALALSVPDTNAQANTNICRTAIVLDRSGSVGETNLKAMREQVRMLFRPVVGLHDSRYQLAFWSFSSTVNRTSNYDAPFHTYISSKAVNNATFESALAALTSAGGTNYEQGFGFDGHALGNQTMNTRDGMDKIIKDADVIVFLTDGVPNTPGQGDGNTLARNAAREAVRKLKGGQAGIPKDIVGGVVGNVNDTHLRYVISGAPTDIFRINANYDNLAEVVRQKTQEKCSDKIVPNPSSNYSLLPTVSTPDRVASGSGSASFMYNVNNSATAGASDPTTWSVKRLVVNRNQSVEELNYPNKSTPSPDDFFPYKDGFSCEKLLVLIANKGSCQEVATGERSFMAGSNSLNGDPAMSPEATSVVIDDDWGVGTKVCNVLTVAKPTQNDEPVERHSRAACLIIGTKPFVQVHGGDLRVGRHFNGDSIETREDEEEAPIAPSVWTSQVTKADGYTYGSWVEYGVMAPGPIRGIASLSAYEGGYQAFQPNDCDERLNRLTFANMDNDCGYFVDDEGVEGAIPDVAGALLNGREPTGVLSGSEPFSIKGAGFIEGLYRRTGGNLELAESMLEPGKSVLIHVPDGTLTISGNISYSDGPYTNIDQIPQLVIIAKNIAIKPSVVNVNAWLITTGTNADGHVSTCDEPKVLTSEICNQLLTINGPVMARHLDLRRTGGSGRGGAAGDPAEVFNLPADAFLWTQSEGKSEVRAQTTYTTELPPYF